MSTESEIIAFLSSFFHELYSPVPDYWPDKFPGWKEPFLAEYLKRKGKALRPLLLLSGFLMEKCRQSAIDFPDIKQIEHFLKERPTVTMIATALERFHTMLMAMDDLFDGGTERRGGKALHLLFVDYARGKTFRRDDGVYLGAASPRAFVFDIFLASTYELFDSLCWAINAKGASIPAISEFNPFVPLQTLSIRAYSDRGEPVPLDYLIYKCQIMIDCIKILTKNVQTDNPKVIESFIQMLQITLDGEWRDLAWAGGTEKMPGEQKTRQIYARQEGLYYWPDEKMPTLDEVLTNQLDKTSFYSITFPLMAGMLLTNPELNDETKKPVEEFGSAFGRAFQIHDDLLLCSEASGKSSLTDLTRGSKTVVTVGVCNILEGKAKVDWLKTLKRSSQSERARQKALNIINQSRIKNKCVELIAENLNICQETVQTLKQKSYWTAPLDYLIRSGVSWMDDARVEAMEVENG